jgi:hypothetical protein
MSEIALEGHHRAPYDGGRRHTFPRSHHYPESNVVTVGPF